MALSRRAFLGSLGVGAAALALGGLSLPVEAAAPALDATLCVGDVFTIAGRYAVNPGTGRASPYLQSFVVTAITGATVTCSPPNAITRSSIRPLASVHRPPPR